MGTTVKKVSSAHSPTGEMGQTYLASGKRVSMRLWQNEAATADKEATARDYETVGSVISGKATLEIGDQRISLEPGDSWLAPAGAKHRYDVLEAFTAIEATAPPAAAVRGRD